jgi:hypothetical protein
LDEFSPSLARSSSPGPGRVGGTAGSQNSSGTTSRNLGSTSGGVRGAQEQRERFSSGLGRYGELGPDFTQELARQRSEYEFYSRNRITNPMGSLRIRSTIPKPTHMPFVTAAQHVYSDSDTSIRQKKNKCVVT